MQLITVDIRDELIYGVKAAVIERDPVSNQVRTVHIVEGDEIGKVYSTLFGNVIVEEREQ